MFKATTKAPLLVALSLAACTNADLRHQEKAQSASAQSTGLAHVIAASLPSWLAKIPAGRHRDYGFASAAEARRATAGEAYRVFIGQPEAILRGDAEGAFSPTEHWRVALRVGGENRALLTVRKTGDGFEVVDFGAALLARQIERAERDARLFDTSLHRALLRDHRTACDLLGYFAATENERVWRDVLPLPSATAALGLKGIRTDRSKLVKSLARAHGRLK